MLNHQSRKIIEIVDITDEEAETYLSKMMPKELTKGSCWRTFCPSLDAVEEYQLLSKNTDLLYAMDDIQDYMFKKEVKHCMWQV